MITLGHATLVVDDDLTYEVSIGIRWTGCSAWTGFLGAQLDWDELAGHSLQLEVPGWLGPCEEPVVTSVQVDAVLENELQAHGVVLPRDPRHEHRTARVRERAARARIRASLVA